MSVKKYIDPVLVDKFVQEIQIQIEQFPWVGESYGLVGEGVDKDGKKYPQIYLNDGTWRSVSLLPDTNKKSLSYFSLDGNVVVDTTDDYESLVIPLALYFWGRLDKMLIRKKYDYTSELINDMLYLLLSLPKEPQTNIERVEDIQYNTDFNSLFGRFNYAEQDTQILTKMYTGFVIRFTLITDSLCMRPINT